MEHQSIWNQKRTKKIQQILTSASLNHHRYRINAGWYAHKWLTYNNNNNKKKVRKYTQKGSFILIKFATHACALYTVVVVIPLLTNMFILFVWKLVIFSAQGGFSFYFFFSVFLFIRMPNMFSFIFDSAHKLISKWKWTSKKIIFNIIFVFLFF